ncbi:hypothetical protein K504DRAFT_503039 [Pleomassaria siparia CBS 279.74]|uniref:Mid2 domain-containing protein n=1 Tax=Pleomassaria siparia CBS 279.74 TaxID=1314801 RepID=A0A6G1K9C3_9PLEO|nr:hypothetical protein K504DRAFT_503039 [Pleomassaria siparia CBS 279.74]
MRLAIRAAISIALSHLQLALAADICYNKDGVQYNNAFPCKPDADASGCCDFGWVCLSNGLCQPGPEATNNGFVDYYRPDGCTDPTWSNPACFSACNKFQGNGLEPCGSGTFCCYDMQGCDCTASNSTLLTLGAATIITTISLTSPTPSPSSTPVSTLASTTSAATTSSSTSNTPAPISPEEASAPSTTEAASSSGFNGTTVGAGIGIGLGVPIIALTIILVIVIKRSRRGGIYHRARDENEEKHEMEVPHVVHEISEGYYSPAQKRAEQLRLPHELDINQSRQLTPGWGWHR